MSLRNGGRDGVCTWLQGTLLADSSRPELPKLVSEPEREEALSWPPEVVGGAEGKWGSEMGMLGALLAENVALPLRSEEGGPPGTLFPSSCSSELVRGSGPFPGGQLNSCLLLGGLVGPTTGDCCQILEEEVE